MFCIVPLFGLSDKFKTTMILFTLVTTPEPQMFDGYFDGLKDELEMCYIKLFYKIITLLEDMSTS